jgi:hypothetical protein
MTHTLEVMSDYVLPPFSSPIGTWDEWLALRQPSGTGAKRSDADFVAYTLQRGGAGLATLDLGMPLIRNGFRDLMAEFEAATAGTQVQFRAAVLPSTLRVVHATANEGNVAIVVGDPDNAADSQLILLSQEPAREFARTLVNLIQDLYGSGPGAGDGGG